MDRPSRRRKKRVPYGGGDAPWMLTYSDMVTLLLTFFIFLFAMSAIDLDRFKITILSIQSSLFGHSGILDNPIELEGADGQGADSLNTGNRALEQALLDKVREAEALQSQVESFLVRVGRQGTIGVRLEERGVVMELPNQIIFEQASADLKPRAKEYLDDLAQLFRETENKIIIEGHTCNIPMNTARFPSNWDLSVGRSVQVTRYLVEVHGLEPGRFIATGYGEYQPLETNDTARGRARNRRVTIVLSTLK